MTWPVATLVIVTLAPLTTAPDGSLTVPTMLPVPTVVWANNGRPEYSTASTLPRARRSRRTRKLAGRGQSYRIEVNSPSCRS